VLRVEGVFKSYPELDLCLDFSVAAGELVSILGPSGSGRPRRSAWWRIRAAERGRVLVDGHDVTRVAPEKRRVGFVFQDYTLFPHMDVFRNVAYGLKVRGASRAQTKQVVTRYLGLVGLEGFEGRNVSTLSGGEQQRVAIARSLPPLRSSAPGRAVLFYRHGAQARPSPADARASEGACHHSGLRHAQPGGGPGHLRQGRGDEAGAHRTGRDSARALRAAASRFVAAFVGEASFIEAVAESSAKTRWRCGPTGPYP